MATKTFYVSNAVATGDTGPKVVESNSGITAANIGGYDLTSASISGSRYASYIYTSGGTNNSDFSGHSTNLIDAAGNTGPGQMDANDHWRSDVTYSGTFAAGTWNFDLIMTGAGSSGDVNFLWTRVWRSANANGSSATLIGSTFFSSSMDISFTTVSYTWSNPSFSLTNEYLFFQHMYSTNTSSPLNGTRHTHRSSTTAQITTSNFTAASSGSLILPPSFTPFRHTLIR